MKNSNKDLKMKQSDYTDSNFKRGDKCYLFTRFPFSFELISQLPLTIYPGVHFIRTPEYALKQSSHINASHEEHVAWAGWIYPAYGLPGISVCEVCLKIDYDTPIPNEAKNLWFWMAVAALYLVKPLFINIGGAFIYGDQEHGFLGREGERLDYRSNICLDGRADEFPG